VFLCLDAHILTANGRLATHGGRRRSPTPTDQSRTVAAISFLTAFTAAAGIRLAGCPRIDEIPDFLLVDWRQDMNHTDQIGQRGRIVIGPSQGKLERRADEALRLAARMGLACAGDGRGSRRDDGATS